jgi:peptidoglycan/LPS O-acetylase OafA/YrhL
MMHQQKGFHIPSLDGMRALAAILVFVSHAGLGHIIPGGLGVTIFFFLSGYLICTLLRMEFEKNGEISLKNFYLRRACRILPPMYFVLIMVLVLAELGVVRAGATASGIAAQFFQFTNYYLLVAPEANLPPHTTTFWSLAVEEHFYLVFPVALLFCLRRWGYRTVSYLLLTTCLAVLCWRAILVCGLNVSEQRTYFATDTRLDSLLFGCTLGLWLNPALDQVPKLLDQVSTKIAAGLFGVSLLLFTLAVRNPVFRETIRYTLQGIALFPLFWLAIRHPTSVVFRPLNWSWMRRLGVVSYSFYLLHLFWLKIIEENFPFNKVETGVLALIGTVGMAVLMHLYIEKPFGVLKNRLTTQRKHVPGVEDDRGSAIQTKAPSIDP